MEFRALESADRADAVALWHRTGLTRPWNLPGEDFDRAASGTASAVLGAVEGDRLVATAMVGHDGHRGWVYYVAVDPDRQGTGLGRAIMDAAAEWVRSAGVPKLQLMVRSGNSAASGFYDALGFGVEDTIVRSRWLVPSGDRGPAGAGRQESGRPAGQTPVSGGPDAGRLPT